MGRTCKSVWQLTSQDTGVFGDQLWCEVTAKYLPAPAPTPTAVDAPVNFFGNFFGGAAVDVEEAPPAPADAAAEEVVAAPAPVSALPAPVASEGASSDAAEGGVISVAGSEISEIDQLEAASSCDEFVMVLDAAGAAPTSPVERSTSEVSAASAIAMVEASTIAEAADAAEAAATAAAASLAPVVEVVAAPDAVVQLPAGWEGKTTPDGRMYY